MTRTGLIVGALVALHVVVGLAGFVAPYDPTSQDRSSPYAPPTALHMMDARGELHPPFVYAQVPDPNDPAAYINDTSRRFPVQLLANDHLLSVDAPARLSLLGTDGFGRDVFSRVLHGGRVSLAAGLLATLCALLVGMTLGTLAGFFGGFLDRIVMRAADVFMALPWIYLLFAVRAALPLHIDTRATFLMLVAVLGVVGLGSAGPHDSRHRPQRTRAHVRARRRRLRRLVLVPAVAAHHAPHLRRSSSRRPAC